MSDTRASLGGKGANLVRLARAGLPVPAFVVVDTQEYREFVRARGLDDVIDAALAAADHDVGSGGDAAAAAALTASQTIRAAFAGTLPTGQRIRLSDTVAELGDVPVAVRSSATAEDLPDLSFAGQQDSFLNVTGTSDVLASIVACWSSLWTDRAIHYRARAGIPSRRLAIAVVVQAMVPAEAAGVLFTADPVSGHRGHTMIDAVFGLGEGLVAGQVTPDSYHVDRARRAIRRTLQGPEPTLTDPQIWRLVDLGARIEEVFGSPQDVEWVRVGEELYVVQSRPITSLYPLAVAARELPEPSLWLSFGAVQGMLEPITPLGQDVLALLVCGAARVFGGRPDYRTTTAIQSAGERLWIRVDTLLRSPIGRPVLTRFLPLAEPGAAAIVATLAEEPAFARRGVSTAGPHLLTGARFGRRVAPYLPVTLAQPERTVATLHRQAEAFVEEVADRLAAADGQPEESARLAARVQVLTREGTRAMGVLLPLFGRVMPVGLALVGRLRAVAAHTGLPEADALALAVLRALPGNVTTDMNLALWDVAQAIRSEPDALSWWRTRGPAELIADYRAGALPPVAQHAVEGFLARYGMRGVAEIDVGAPRWRDDPEHVLRTLSAYLSIVDPLRAPEVVYRRGRRDASAALRTLAAHSRPAAARGVGFLGKRIRRIMGVRETPKFTLVRVFGLFRQALLDSGADLVRAGVLDQPEDVFHLRLAELADAFAAPAGTLRDRVAERRQRLHRERRRTRVPLIMVSDGRTFYPGERGEYVGDPTGSGGAGGTPEASGTPGAGLRGTGVSPGTVEGLVRVVHDPRSSDLQPGEILVCAGTDPAWTPLFLTASGLITEVGGLMTHGSVVAREYGIPAIVGVGGATTALHTGQRIRLDGATGVITPLG